MEPETKPNPENKQVSFSQNKEAEYLAGWQRERADFINYKKEEVERIKAWLEYAAAETNLKILSVLDSFHLAEKSLPDDLKSNEYVKGLLQIKSPLEGFLKEQGISEIKSVGEKFDPFWHEAVEQVSQPEKESDTIVEEIRKGYTINGKLLRPAKVKINKV